MKLCFVAKDKEEFVKYLRGLNSVGALGCLPRKIVPSILNDPLGRDSFDHKIYKTDESIGFEWASVLASGDMSRNLRTYVMMNARQGDKDNVRDNLGSSDRGAKTDQLNFLNDIEYCMREDGGDVLDDDAFLFIHWGDGDPSCYEEQFQPFCDKHFNGLRAFALSSRRPELFTVTAAEIIPPQTEEGALELIAKASFYRIEDLMVEYVMNFFSLAQEGDEEKIATYEIGDGRKISPLEFFLRFQAKRLKARSHLSDVEKRRFQTLNNLIDGVDWAAKAPQISYLEATAELFAALIKEDGHV